MAIARLTSFSEILDIDLPESLPPCPLSTVPTKCFLLVKDPTEKIKRHPIRMVIILVDNSALQEFDLYNISRLSFV
jgi:hypothetical protein